MRKLYVLPLLMIAVFTLGFFSPVFATGGMYDDFGNYLEFEDEDPYEEVDEEENAFFDQFSTSWFLDHPGKTEYTISTSSQLQGLATLVNEGHFDEYGVSKYEDFQGITIRLGRDITLKKDFTPIGRSDETIFKGTFDGAGHTIKGLNVDENGGDAGLFGYLDGTVKNLTVEGRVRASGPVCGGLAGYVSGNGVIWKCTSYAEVSGKAKTGGIAGFNDGGTITGCMNWGNVEGTMKVGGIVGENWGTVRKCGNRGEIRSSRRGATTYGTGGVCGRSVSGNALIDQCFNTGKVFSGTEGTGGICGYMNARGSEIISSYNTGHISVRNNAVINTTNIRGYAGGIVGIAGVKGVKITDCYNAGSINNSDISGGVIGSYDNESEMKGEPYISHNFYMSSSGLKGVGRDDSGKAQNYREGTEKITQATLISSASKLGPAYTEDSLNYYGANGYPVLNWQIKVGKVKSARLSCITEEKQAQFDRYMRKSSLTSGKEWPVMMFFHNNAFTSKAIGDFYEK